LRELLYPRIQSENTLAARAHEKDEKTQGEDLVLQVDHQLEVKTDAVSRNVTQRKKHAEHAALRSETFVSVAQRGQENWAGPRHLPIMILEKGESGRN